MGGRPLVDGLRAPGRRDFWTFKVIHALLGALLTIGGACGAIFIGDGIRKQAGAVGDQIATVTSRIDSIAGTLLQFRVVQSNGVLLGAISTNDAVRPEYRESFTALMFVLRHGPVLAMLGELYQHDVDAFRRERDELDKLIAAATGRRLTATTSSRTRFATAGPGAGRRFSKASGDTSPRMRCAALTRAPARKPGCRISGSRIADTP